MTKYRFLEHEERYGRDWWRYEVMTPEGTRFHAVMAPSRRMADYQMKVFAKTLDEEEHA